MDGSPTPLRSILLLAIAFSYLFSFSLSVNHHDQQHLQYFRRYNYQSSHDKAQSRVDFTPQFLEKYTHILQSQLGDNSWECISCNLIFEMVKSILIPVSAIILHINNFNYVSQCPSLLLLCLDCLT